MPTPAGTHIDLITVRSADGGLTWSSPTVLDRNPSAGTNLSTDKTSACNPVSLYDASDNRLYVFDLRLPNGVSAASAKTTTGQMQTWSRYSTDGGQTWSASTQITTPTYANFYPNIGSGIETSSGRLVVPATAYPTTSGSTQSFALYSDDHGTTWKAGTLINSGTNEEQIVQLANGNLLSNARQNSGSSRIQTISTDGGATWGTPTNSIAMTTVAAGLLRYSTGGVNGATQNQLLFSYPAGSSVDARSKLTIASSFDEGTSYAASNVLYQGYAAYSDMVRLGGDQVGVLWERGTNEAMSGGAYQDITYSAINSDFLNPSTASGLLATESFGYSAATLGRAIGGNGWNTTWAATGTLSGASSAAIVQSGLSRDGLGYTPSGGAASLQGTAMSRGLATTLNLAGTRTFYVSALVDRNAVSGTGNQNLDLKLLDASGTTQMSFGATAAGTQWYVNQFGTETDTTAAAIASQQVYFLVAKIVASGGVDQLFFKSFGTADSIPASDIGLDWTLAGTAATSSAVLSGVMIDSGSNSQWLVDELRVGTDWSSVAAPEPASASAAAVMIAFGFLMQRQRR